MFVTIGKHSSLGNPIIYDRQDLSREALFDLLSTKVTSQLSAITGEEYRQVDDQYQRLVGKLKEQSDELAGAALDVYSDLHEWTYSAVAQAYEHGFSDAIEYDNHMDYMTEEQEKVLAQLDDGLGVVTKLLEEQARHKQITYEQAVTDFVASFAKHLEGHHGH